MNLKNIKTAYLIGIKGVGMTALAQVLQGAGVKVSGSDTKERFFTDEVLKRLNIKVFEGFDGKNVPADVDLVVSSVAYLGDEANNQEIAVLRGRNKTVYTYPQVLGMLFNECFGIAVSGAHGKSTTTAMLGVAMEGAGADPTVVVGTRVIEWKSNARVGASKYFVIEADEYREAFQNYNPHILVLTNIEYDHPDYFRDETAYKTAFIKLIKRMPADGIVVANSEGANIGDAVKDAPCKVVFYKAGDLPEDVRLLVPGQHNRSNAAAVLAVIKTLGLDVDKARSALSDFRGVSRRLELKGVVNGVTLIDDYAHHPTEVMAALAAVRKTYGQQKIWAVFQPHTFSRTEALMSDFGGAFREADNVIVLDIYGSARESGGKVTSDDLLNEIKKHRSGAICVHSVEDAVTYLKKKAVPEDVIVTMGAGDVWRILEIFAK